MGIVPFKALVGLMLKGNTAKLWCGAGRDCFAITPRGEIMACPIDPSLDFQRAGSITTTDPDKLKGFASVGAPCPSCEIFGICGGRCLYFNKVRLWGEDAFGVVCMSVKHLVGELKKALPRIKQLIADGKIPQSAFDYPDGNNNCEIIP
jgi:radical SAM protein with 4Fe4S-binding SPASM domain